MSRMIVLTLNPMLGFLVCSPHILFSNKLVHIRTTTGLGSTTSAPRGADIED